MDGIFRAFWINESFVGNWLNGLHTVFKLLKTFVFRVCMRQLEVSNHNFTAAINTIADTAFNSIVGKPVVNHSKTFSHFGHFLR